MTLKVAIGITTYTDILSEEFAARIYDAYSETSPRIVPDQAWLPIYLQKQDIRAREDFTRQWSMIVPVGTREMRSRVVERNGFMTLGAEWRKRGQLSGKGNVNFRPTTDPAGSNTISISHNYTPKIDWLKFFQKLCSIFNPSYGMIHLFDKAECERAASSSLYEKFDGPVVGEKIFTSWKSALDHWRGPDQWQLKERRSYRYLPQLSWGNFLGPEFDGQYDRAGIEKAAASFDRLGDGVLFTTTPSFDDIRKNRAEFEDRRLLLRKCFEPGFFRS